MSTSNENYNPYKKGFYADPKSPIASSPMKKFRTDEHNKMTNGNIYLSTLVSPIAKVQHEHYYENSLQDENYDHNITVKLNMDDSLNKSTESNQSSRDAHWGSRVYDLFSPVLKFFGENEKAHSISLISESTDSHCASENLSGLCLLNSPEDESGTETHLNRSVATETTEDEDSSFSFNPYYYIRTLPPYADVSQALKVATLPEKRSDSPKISLILDLDETLVHCGIDKFDDPDFTFQVEFDGEDFTLQGKKRPHMDYFLEQVSQMFEVVVFTASQKIYAEKVLDCLDPERKLLSYRLYRDHCLPVDGNYLKDLNVLGRDLSKVALVDNSPHAFAYQISNGIPIESWFDDDSDTELLKLLPFLKSLLPHDDIRPIIQEQFKILELVGEATP